MFRRPILFLALLCCAQGLMATDRTYELLKAPHVRDKIRLQLSSDRKGVEYQKDGETRFAELADGTTFALHDQADIVFRDFNPFLYSISTSQKTEPDPNFGSIVKLLDAAQQLATGEGFPFARIAQTRELSRAMIFGQQITDEMEWCPELSNASEECKPLTRFKCLLEQANELTEKTGVDQNDFNEWKDLAVNATGVREAREHINQTVADLSKAITDLKQVLDDIKTTRTQLPNTSCTSTDPEIPLLYTDVQQSGEVNLQAKRDLKVALENLSRTLEAFQSPSSWREDRLTDYIIAKPKADPDNIVNFAVTIKDRNFVVDNGSFKVEEKEATTKTFRLRKYSGLVPGGLMGRIRNAGLPLWKFLGGSPQYGIKTGRALLRGVPILSC